MCARSAELVPAQAGNNAGNLISDSRLGSVYAYTYNNANRLKTVAYEGNLKGTYTYNGLEQLITRVITNSGANDGTVHTVHDRSGNVIAEANASGQKSREYIWLPGTGAVGTDLPLAVVSGVDTGSPVLYHVHADQTFAWRSDSRRA